MDRGRPQTGRSIRVGARALNELPQCVVLGGGRGSRLRPLTDTVPKPMVEVAGEPFVVHQMRWLAGCGIERVVYSIGYLGDQIRRCLESARADLGLDVVFVDEGDRALGTAGALRLALAEGLLEDEFVLLYGDSYLDLDLVSAVELFRSVGREALMTVCEVRGSEHRPNVRLAEDLVVEYDKAASDEEIAAFHHIDYGVSLLRSSTIETRVPSAGPSDLSGVLADLAAEGGLSAFVVPRMFEEIGSPEGLARVRSLLEGSA